MSAINLPGRLYVAIMPLRAGVCWRYADGSWSSALVSMDYANSDNVLTELLRTWPPSKFLPGDVLVSLPTDLELDRAATAFFDGSKRYARIMGAGVRVTNRYAIQDAQRIYRQIWKASSAPALRSWVGLTSGERAAIELMMMDVMTSAHAENLGERLSIRPSRERDFPRLKKHRLPIAFGPADDR